MKKIAKFYFPALLILACIAVYYWHHALTGLILPYLPNKEVLPVALLMFFLLALTFLSTFVLLKQSETKKTILFAIISTVVMFLLLLVAGTQIINYAAHRYAGILPVITYPELPKNIVTTIVTFLCVLHLTGLLICRFVKEKRDVGHIFYQRSAGSY